MADTLGARLPVHRRRDVAQTLRCWPRVRIAKGAVVTGQEARRRPTAIVGITGIRRQLQRVQGIWENDSRLAEKGCSDAFRRVPPAKALMTAARTGGGVGVFRHGATAFVGENRAARRP